jgi:hypothetical protein
MRVSSRNAEDQAQDPQLCSLEKAEGQRGGTQAAQFERGNQEMTEKGRMFLISSN